MKPLPLFAALVVGGATLWSAGWFVGKTVFVEPEADRAVEDIRAGRMFFSFKERSIGGFPFGYNVAYHGVSVSDSSTTWRWTVPEIEVASGGADSGALTLTTSPSSVLEISSGGGGDASPTVFDIETKDFLVHLQQGGKGGSIIDAEATEIAAVQRGAGGLISGARFVVSDLVYALRPESAVAGEVGLTASRVEAAYRMSADGVSETWSESTSHGVVLAVDYDATGYDAANPFMFVTEGGSVAATLNIASGEGRSGSTGGPSAVPFTGTFTTGESTARIAVGQGRLSYGGEGAAARFDVTYEEGGPIPGFGFEMGRAAVDFSMPTEVSAETQPYSLMISGSDITLDDGLWGQFDPGAALRRDPMLMTFDVAGNARIFRDLMSFEVSERHGPPIELETLTLRDVRFAGLGAGLSATGELDVRGVAAQPDGEISIVIDGALAVIDQLTAAGLIELDAANLYKAMGQQILRPGEGEDQFIADVVSKGGNVSINGVSLGQ